MGLRSWLRKLERVSREELASFELLDGSLYFYDPATPELFMHWYDCIGAGNPDSWPAPPEVVRKLTEAKDPRAALAEVMGDGDDYLTYEPDPYQRTAARAPVPHRRSRPVRPGGRGPQRVVVDPWGRSLVFVLTARCPKWEKGDCG
jgi:hypothetical protein